MFFIYLIHALIEERLIDRFLNVRKRKFLHVTAKERKKQQQQQKKLIWYQKVIDFFFRFLILWPL
jgi:pantothenate kinase